MRDIRGATDPRPPERALERLQGADASHTHIAGGLAKLAWQRLQERATEPA